MKFPSFIVRFGWRLLWREWPKYTLAFLSLLITSITFTLVLVGVDGARIYLAERSREFVGGDIAFESGSPVDMAPLIEPLKPWITGEDREVELTLSVRSTTGTTAVSARALSSEYPLYGELLLQTGTYRALAPEEVLVEPIVLERLKIAVGDELLIGTVVYRVAGVILAEPDALLQGFRFAPRLILSEAGLERTEIKLRESRNEYEYRYRLDPSRDAVLLEQVQARALAQGMEVRVAGDGQSGFLRRLETVERFFLITVLIGAVLSAVNIYANALTLVTRLRKSFAIFLVEGASKGSILALVLGIIGGLTLLATMLGIGGGMTLITWLYHWLQTTTEIALPLTLSWSTLGLILLGTLATSLAAAFPAVRDLLTLEPKVLLTGLSTRLSRTSSLKFTLLLSALSFLPIFLLAALLLGRLDRALFVVGGTGIVFVMSTLLFGLLIRWVYQWREKLSFIGRIIIAEKRADGIFGLVALTSLSIALASIFSLALLERSIERFFEAGIGRTLPSAYVIDVQSDQVNLVQEIIPSIKLFPNVRARILRIDDRMIQERLADGVEDEDRELRREFNLTYRKELLESETITRGTWQGNARGEVSVEADFAKRARIELGSILEFFIQGVRVSAGVTSLRQTDTTSGLPFFYFVFHPDDLNRFPASFFGYAEIMGRALRQAETSLATMTPNVSVLDTSAIGETVRGVTATVLFLVVIITFPPLLLAVLLLFSLIAATYAGRQRDLLRLQVVGATRRFTTFLYLLETVMTVIVAGFIGFGLALIVISLLTQFVLEGVEPIWIDIRVVEILAALSALLLVYAVVLLRLRPRSLRQALMYEENV